MRQVTIDRGENKREVIVRHDHDHGFAGRHRWTFVEWFKGDTRGYQDNRMARAQWQHWGCIDQGCPAMALVPVSDIELLIARTAAVSSRRRK